MSKQGQLFLGVHGYRMHGFAEKVQQADIVEDVIILGRLADPRDHETSVKPKRETRNAPTLSVTIAGQSGTIRRTPGNCSV